MEDILAAVEGNPAPVEGNPAPVGGILAAVEGTPAAVGIPAGDQLVAVEDMQPGHLNLED